MKPAPSQIYDESSEDDDIDDLILQEGEEAVKKDNQDIESLADDGMSEVALISETPKQTEIWKAPDGYQYKIEHFGQVDIDSDGMKKILFPTNWHSPDSQDDVDRTEFEAIIKKMSEKEMSDGERELNSIRQWTALDAEDWTYDDTGITYDSTDAEATDIMTYWRDAVRNNEPVAHHPDSVTPILERAYRMNDGLERLPKIPAKLLRVDRVMDGNDPNPYQSKIHSGDYVTNYPIHMSTSSENLHAKRIIDEDAKKCECIILREVESVSARPLLKGLLTRHDTEHEWLYGQHHGFQVSSYSIATPIFDGDAPSKKGIIPRVAVRLKEVELTHRHQAGDLKNLFYGDIAVRKPLEFDLDYAELKTAEKLDLQSDEHVPANNISEELIDNTAQYHVCHIDDLGIYVVNKAQPSGILRIKKDIHPDLMNANIDDEISVADLLNYAAIQAEQPDYPPFVGNQSSFTYTQESFLPITDDSPLDNIPSLLDKHIAEIEALSAQLPVEEPLQEGDKGKGKANLQNEDETELGALNNFIDSELESANEKKELLRSSALTEIELKELRTFINDQKQRCRDYQKRLETSRKISSPAKFSPYTPLLEKELTQSEKLINEINEISQLITPHTDLDPLIEIIRASNQTQANQILINTLQVAELRKKAIQTFSETANQLITMIKSSENNIGELAPLLRPNIDMFRHNVITHEDSHQAYITNINSAFQIINPATSIEDTPAATEAPAASSSMVTHPHQPDKRKRGNEEETEEELIRQAEVEMEKFKISNPGADFLKMGPLQMAPYGSLTIIAKLYLAVQQAAKRRPTYVYGPYTEFGLTPDGLKDLIEKHSKGKAFFKRLKNESCQLKTSKSSLDQWEELNTTDFPEKRTTKKLKTSNTDSGTNTEDVGTSNTKSRFRR